MLERALPLVLLLGCPAVVVSQTPSVPPRPAAPPKQVGRIPALTDKQQKSVKELQRLITLRDALTKEIQRLRKITGQHQQVIASVKVCELSLNKARNTIINVEGVESEWLHVNGFGGALSAGVFDNLEQPEGEGRVKSGSETFQTRVIENDEVLQKTVAELEKAGALIVLAEQTFATVSGRPASLNVGGEFPIPVPQTNGGSTIEFKEFGTRLDLVPVVLGQSPSTFQVCSRPLVCREHTTLEPRRDVRRRHEPNPKGKWSRNRINFSTPCFDTFATRRNHK